MNYDKELWKKYTDENENIQCEQSKFIHFLSVALWVKKIFEI